jgi:hypothetical protein
MPMSRVRLSVQMLLVRLRFPLLLLGVLLLISAWPWLRNRWDQLTRPGSGIDTSISLDTEYWCPMCPGVVSDWPARCPVCSMQLVRRKKGEATPLPDGVVARMQFSPYRVQLAGIHTTPAEFRPLVWEAAHGGLIEPGESSGRVRVTIEIPEFDVGYVRSGLAAEVESEAYPGQTFPARVVELGRWIKAETLSLPVRLEVDNPREELLSGMFVTVRLRVPLTQLDRADRLARDGWRDRTAVEIALRFLPAFAAPLPGLESLLEGGAREAFRRQGLTLAVPTSAVIDTGERKVVFVERMPGMFDGVEVQLGRRCGDYYPVLRGLEPGQQVVTAGAFLLDAETRLNPSLAASYFGAGARPGRTGGTGGDGSQEKLSPTDQQLIAKQKICPVTGEPLGSMGTPVRVVLEGKPVFICCKGCESELRSNPKQYLSKLRPQ